MSRPHKVFRSNLRVISSMAPITVQVLILALSAESVPWRAWSWRRDPAPAGRTVHRGRHSAVSHRARVRCLPSLAGSISPVAGDLDPGRVMAGESDSVEPAKDLMAKPEVVALRNSRHAVANVNAFVVPGL